MTLSSTEYGVQYTSTCAAVCYSVFTKYFLLSTAVYRRSSVVTAGEGEGEDVNVTPVCTYSF